VESPREASSDIEQMLLPFYYLSVAALPSSSALLLHSEPSRSSDGNKPVVLGTLQLNPEEVAGHLPIFVDAFLNQIGGSSPPAWGARIVLSYEPVYGRCPPKGKPNRPGCSPVRWVWSELRWTCRWREPGVSFRRQVGLEEEAEVVQDARGFNESALVNANAPGAHLLHEKNKVGHHHALVVSCRLPQALAHLQAWELDITAAMGTQQHYARRGITVYSRPAFVREGTRMALCTMVNSPDDLLWPWAKFHAQAGFDQILVYVELANTEPVAKKLRDLMEAGLVTLVPYYFGQVSSCRKFAMQASMEEHCLYQAKGRAAWLGHADVDEFFDLRGSLRSLGLQHYLESLPKDTPGVNAQMTYFRKSRHPRPRAAKQWPFPCGLTCRWRDYAPKQRGSKWIARPDMIQVISPHRFATSRNVTFPDPDKELRVNHFRHCKRGGNCTLPRGVARARCVEDDSFVDYCSAQLLAATPKTA